MFKPVKAEWNPGGCALFFGDEDSCKKDMSRFLKVEEKDDDRNPKAI